MDTLRDRLQTYCKQDYVPMHMPGAKRNTDLFHMDNPYGLDITEIEGFDNLHHADGILNEMSQKAAKLFHAEQTLLLINGSSAGILSAICGSTHKKDCVIVARNCHKSVYDALYLNELNPVYLYPKVHSESNQYKNYDIYGEITAEQVEMAFQTCPQASVVILTSPTYEGVTSDISAIAQVVHRHGKILIVDEAHGAHFGFDQAFPKSAVVCGADIVIQSIHKTLPAFTQSALLHMNGNRVNRIRVKKYWDRFQTTSPSYILMSGIDYCLTVLETRGTELFSDYIQRLLYLRRELKKLKNIHLLESDDISKIVLLVSDGKVLYNKLLQDYHIQLEMAARSYVIAMTSIGDKDEYYERFLTALIQIDDQWTAMGFEQESNQIYNEKTHNVISNRCESVISESATSESTTSDFVIGQSVLCRAQVVMNLYDAQNYEENELVEVSLAEGRIAADTVCFYPPGIPLVNPGERITRQVIAQIQDGMKHGLEVLGVETNTQSEIENKSKGMKLRCLK